jgi:hypothetical protein
MAYWIHENGETVGPMRAIDVLRRATPSTRVCDGKIWFTLEGNEESDLAAEIEDKPSKPEHITIRYGSAEADKAKEAV